MKIWFMGLIIFLGGFGIVPKLWGYEVILTDPKGDDFGPGTYRYPITKNIQKGDFDLLQVRIWDDKANVNIEVTVAGGFRWIRDIYVNESERIDLFLQTIDIYIDQNTAGPAFSQLIPGRNLALAKNMKWNKAILLSPIPYDIRSRMKFYNKPMAASVIIPQYVKLEGTRLVASVSKKVLGGSPSDSWGYLVVITGTPLLRNLAYTDKLRGDNFESFINPVGANEDVCTLIDQKIYKCYFGGCNPCGYHPNVLDVILPPGISQRIVLTQYSKVLKLYATVPLYYPKLKGDPRLAVFNQPKPLPQKRVFKIVDLTENTFTIDLGETSPEKWIGKMATVTDGKKKFQAVVIKAFENVLILKTIDSKAVITKTMQVIFP